MEDFATPNAIGGALDGRAFGDGGAVGDRVPGGKVFCESLHKFAGIPNADDLNERPKVFVEEIDDVMQKFNDMQKQTVQPKMVQQQVKVKGKTKTVKRAAVPQHSTAKP